jgi:hypothetical protein
MDYPFDETTRRLYTIAFYFFLLRLGVPQAVLLIMATPSCGF